MSFSSNLGGRPTPQAHRRFRLCTGILGIAVLVLLVLQYTSYRLLPDQKTSTLWGVLVGITGMTALLEYLWSRQSIATVKSAKHT